MSNLLYNIEINKPKCYNQTDGMITIHDLSNGALSFTWLDVPQSAIVADFGKSVSNLSCGTYTLKIYNITKKSNETITLDLTCADELTIDLIHIDEPKCYNDNIDMLIEWSGGLSPYSLKINNLIFDTTDKSLVYSAKPNTNYNISITDKNGCMVYRNNIIVDLKPLDAKIQWDPITRHNSFSDKVSCSINGGKAPYKIAWFIANQKKPIIVNQTSIINTLKANTYILKVIDSNNCELNKTFTITEPRPISVNVLTFNDYSTKSLFTPSLTELPYNLLLIPQNKGPDQDTILNCSSITLKYNKITSEQKLCMDYGSITIDDQDYDYYYISPGIGPNTKLIGSRLIIDDKEYDLENKFGSSRAKLIKGSLLIKDDNSFAFHNQDIIRISYDESSIDTQINQVYIKNGWYISNNIYTIININDPNALLFINQFDQLFVQSLTTKTNKRLGSIICNASNGDKNSLSAILINEYNDTKEYSFNNKYTLTINNLKYGQYKLIIKDNYSTASIFNNKIIQQEYFTINILDSDEEERNIASIQSANTFNLDPSILNTYDNRPNKLLFSDPEFKNGVLMNISPLDCCYHITGNNTDIMDCGYKILHNLSHGKYSIKIFKDGYKSQTFKLFYNTNKELVTVILEKDSNNA